MVGPNQNFQWRHFMPAEEVYGAKLITKNCLGKQLVLNLLLDAYGLAKLHLGLYVVKKRSPYHRESEDRARHPGGFGNGPRYSPNPGLSPWRRPLPRIPPPLSRKCRPLPGVSLIGPCQLPPNVSLREPHRRPAAVPKGPRPPNRRTTREEVKERGKEKEKLKASRKENDPLNRSGGPLERR